MAAPASSPRIEIWPTQRAASEAAAHLAADILRRRLAAAPLARVLVATGNSQLDLIATLVALPGIDWDRVEAFHLDEYVGLSDDHPASFRRWIRERFAARVRPRAMYYVEGDAPRLDDMVREYGRRLDAAPVDLAFVGIGENGHIAFNDPPVADFADPATMKRVRLEEACRRQQVNEGHFPNLERVPEEAITVTCSALLRVAHWVCCVPEARKAGAVRASLQGGISTACPGSLVQRHPSAAVFLDAASARELDPEFVRRCCHLAGASA